MPPAISQLTVRSLAAWSAAGRRHLTMPFVTLLALHLAALTVLLWSEYDVVPKVVFALFWGLLNCLWLVVLRRPAAAAAMSLSMIVVLILLSQLKHGRLLVTVNFLDLLIIDTDSFTFLMSVFPGLGRTVGLSVLAASAVVALIWWLDPFRVRRRIALLGASACFTSIVGLSFAFQIPQWEEFNSGNYVSKFARSGAVALVDLMTRGYLESDTQVMRHLALADDAPSCATVRKPPHIIMVFDESSFDISALPGVKLPAGYGSHFASSDGKRRKFVVEGAGGPSWLTEYNVLTGLSVRSYGRFADYVTRIAAGRVERGLPQTLKACGYKTFSLYPLFGAFLGARSFQTTTGIDHFLDAKDLGTNRLEPDGYYYDFTTRLIQREKASGPLFLFVYTAANHFPWDYRFRPDLMKGWRDPGNADPEVDEYLRRQAMSQQDYQAFVTRLKREFPDESFVLVRFGDHLPSLALRMIEPTLDEAEVAKKIAAFDLRFYTTYYALDSVNFRLRDTRSALATLDAPYLPLVVLEAAGLPLDSSFAEQKQILQRCHGLFYFCGEGAEARRFNRLLIEAGLIKGL